MGARSTFLTSFRALLEEVSGLTEHKGATTPEGLPATVARQTAANGSAFVVSMGGSTWEGGRQRGDYTFAEAVVVGLLIDVRQANRPDAYARSMDAEDAILSAVLGSAKVSGWHITWQATERVDAGDGAYLATRMVFTATHSGAL